MVRVYRLYLGPMSAPDKLGREKLSLSLKLGSELLPAPVSAPDTGPVGGPVRHVAPFLPLTKGPVNCFVPEPKAS
jgi:hypothetical protein